MRHKLSLVARRKKRNVAGELFFYILLCKWLPTMQRLGELVQQDLAPVAAVHKASGQTQQNLLALDILGGSSTSRSRSSILVGCPGISLEGVAALVCGVGG